MRPMLTFAAIGCSISLFLLSACTYNPFAPGSPNNHLTGTATGTAIGATAGTATGLILQAPTPGVVALGLGGGAIGYYFSSRRFDEGGIIQSGGQVFSVGDYTTIEIPTDSLFDVNSSEFLPGYEPALLSTIAILNRYPENNVLISGNTNGYGSAKYQRLLSEARARQIAGFLWAHGMNNFRPNPVGDLRKLSYVGYGDYFPIANHFKTEPLRQNGRIQITSYPPRDQLEMSQKTKAFNNIGALDDAQPCATTSATDNASIASASAENAFKDSPQLAKAAPAPTAPEESAAVIIKD